MSRRGCSRALVALLAVSLIGAGGAAAPARAAESTATKAIAAAQTVSAAATHQISGTVTGNGLPVKGVAITDYDQDGNWAETAYSDNAGAFTLSVGSGTRTLWLDVADDMPYMTGWYAATPSAYPPGDARGATPIEIGSADITNLAIVLPVAHYIRGTITGGTGLHKYAGINATDAAGTSVGYRSSNADGTYAVKVPAGTYRLQVSPPPDTQYVAGWYAAAPASHWVTLPGAASPIVVGASDLAGYNMTLPVGTAVTGTLLGATAGGGTKPLAYADIYAIDAAGDVVAPLYTDAAGAFSIPLANGTYRLRADGGETDEFATGWWAQGQAAGANWSPRQAQATTFTVGSGTVVHPTFTLPLSRTISGTATLTVSALAAAARRLVVNIYDADGIKVDTRHIDNAGTYTSFVGPGSYSVAVEAPTSGAWKGGWYLASAIGHWTAARSTASKLVVNTANLTGINITLPKATNALATTITPTTIGAPAAAAIPVALAWTTGLDAAGTVYQVESKTGAGDWTAVSLAKPTIRTVTRALPAGVTTAYRVRAVNATAPGAWIGGATMTAASRQDGTTAVKLAGTGWTKSTSGAPYGGSLRFVAKAGRTATTTFTGTAIAWVGTLGKGYGKAEIWLDGKRVKTISLYAKTTSPRRIVWASSAMAAGSHRLVVKVLGTHATGATGNRVDIDAFLVIGS